MKTFEELGVMPEICEAISEMGFEHPMPVQEEVIPYLLGNGNDVIALAQTGTGKTAAFGLPIIQHIGHPIIGDTVYGGGKTPFEKANASLLDGQILHAKELSFPHPKTKEIMHFECDLPDNFKELLNRLEKLN